MKKLVKCEEVEGEGLLALLGEKILVWCMNYNYHGTLIGVNDDCILLKGATVVYETGVLTGALKDAQELPYEHYVRIAMIESYGKHEG